MAKEKLVRLLLLQGRIEKSIRPFCVLFGHNGRGPG